MIQGHARQHDDNLLVQTAGHGFPHYRWPSGYARRALWTQQPGLDPCQHAAPQQYGQAMALILACHDSGAELLVQVSQIPLLVCVGSICCD